jgi:hypothetical protein
MLLTSIGLIVIISRKKGAVAQLGERLNGIQEVVGSIPISSTNYINKLQNWGCFKI